MMYSKNAMTGAAQRVFSMLMCLVLAFGCMVPTPAFADDDVSAASPSAEGEAARSALAPDMGAV